MTPSQKQAIEAKAEELYPMHIYEDKVDIYTGKMLYKDLNQEKRTDFIEAATFGLSLNEWVSVKDRLPTNEDADENGNILVCFKSGKVISEFWGWLVDDEEKIVYTHWMPLPTPPNK